MPIKPENKAKYPVNWKEIRADILERAGHKCEGSPAYPYCRVPNGHFRNNDTGHVTSNIVDAEAWHWDGESVTKIVLTIAHLNHDETDCRPENLKAWCQKCHLTYDAKLHAQHSNETRRARKAIGDMFSEP